MFPSILMSVRRTVSKKYFIMNHGHVSIRHTFSVSSEYNDVFERIPPTKFNYPEQKIHVPDDTKPILEVWKLEMQHYAEFFKNPRERRLLREILPKNFDIVVIGGGFIGSSLGYWLRERYSEHQSILVIDKNLHLDQMFNKEKPEVTATALAIGNIRQQFSLKEHMEMAKLSVDFFRNMSNYLSTKDGWFNPVPYRPFGFLTLAKKETEETMKETHISQASSNIYNELLTPFQMNARFPWLNTEGIKLGCHGLQDEGWIDPHVLLLTMRNAAIQRGTMFMEAEPLEFIYSKETFPQFDGFENHSYRPTNYIVLKLPDGSLKQISFGTCILALGSETGTFAKELLHLDSKNPGLFGMEIPIERRKRYLFSFEAPEGGIELSSPLVVDPCGLFVNRVGITDYVCGMSPIPEEEPATDNLDVDFDYFYKRVWPMLANRIPAFEQLRLKSGYAYFTDYNTYDGCGIIGRIPAYANIFVTAGFGDAGIQFSPIIGKAMAELLYDDMFSTVELYNMSYKRLFVDFPLHEGISLT